MAPRMTQRFALTSSSASTITVFNADSEIAGVRNFPPNIGELVHSGGDLFFFIKRTNDQAHTSRLKVELITWNPFTDAVATGIPPVPSISGFLWLVRVDTLPKGAYIFTMVGYSSDGTMMMEHYTSTRNAWGSIPCDECVIQDVFVIGVAIAPPLPVFRQFYLDGHVGPLVRFASPQAYVETAGWRSSPLPHAPRPFAALDDLFRYVLLLPRSDQPGKYVLQGEYHPPVETHEAFFTSPEIDLHGSNTHETFVIGANTAALVVQVPRLLHDDDDNQGTMHLYVFKKKDLQWQVVPVPKQFTRDDFERALLCETTLTVAASKRKFQEVDTEQGSSN